MSNFPIINTMLEYFSEREKLNNNDEWIGKSTAAPILTPIYMILRSMKQEWQTILKEKHIDWSIQTSIGQGFATPDHYMALLPKGQKVSNGVYYCVCFDRSGSGCVMGAMTSLQTNQRLTTSTTQRANGIMSGKKAIAWEMCAPYQIDVWNRNNAFFNPIEISKKLLVETPQETLDLILRHIDSSCDVVEQLIAQRKTFF